MARPKVNGDSQDPGDKTSDGRAEPQRNDLEALPAIPEGERMTVVEHSVEQGETLSHISVKYGISVRDLQAANPGVQPRYLRVGMRLTVPILLNR